MENPFENNKPKRSTFLTVLCILTFIGSGWSIFGQLIGLSMSGYENSMMEMQQAYQGGGSKGMEFMKAFMNSSAEILQATALHATAIKLWGLFFSVLSLIGAIFMFNLRKIGFYLYAVAQILALFVLPYYAGFSMVVLISIVMSGFFAVLFIILYAVNLKQLK